MSLLDLSPELLLIVATHVRQVDLLNLSLVCKHLNCALEPELYREYNNPRLYVRPILPFIQKLIAHPVLAKHVRKVDLHPWEFIGLVEPFPDEEGEPDYDELRTHELSQEDYYLYAQAAKAAGVISAIDPYESSSRLIDKAATLSKTQDEPHPWYEYIYDDEVAINDVSYDRKFCQLLRAGVDDAQVVLLLALLPNVREVFVRGGPYDVNALAWRASHNFESLRDLTVCGTDGEMVWPLSFFNHMFSTTRKLETGKFCVASSWYRTLSEPEPDPSHILPVNIQPQSLNCMRTLELKHCCLTASDLRGLIAACPRLESFCYHVGTMAEGTPGPSPAPVIEILEPLKDTLKELYLDVPIVFDDDRKVPEIGSLKHMNALEILDTAAAMWTWVTNPEFELYEYDSDDSDADSVTDRCLYSRLPTTLQKLIFHETEDGHDLEPALNHITDLIRMQPEVLPKLLEIVIETSNEEYIEDLNDTITIVQKAEDREVVKVNFGRSPASVFDSVLPSAELPDTKWFGNKYSIRYRKPGKIGQATKKIGEAYEQGMRGADLTNVLADDPELQAYFASVGFRDEEPAEYYDSDEGPPTPGPWE